VRRQSLTEVNNEAIFFFSYTINSSERQDHLSPAYGAGHAGSDSNFKRHSICEGRKARPTPMDLRSIPVEVHAFESHPSHSKLEDYQYQIL
jgi:hypothetical protein